MGLKILLVDDSVVMRKMILRACRQAGYEVDEAYEAANGEEALRCFETTPVHVIISDLNMPVMDGYEFVRRIRQSDPNVPILLITAEAGKAKLADAVDCGVTAYLNKPPLPEELENKLLEILGPPEE